MELHTTDDLRIGYFGVADTDGTTVRTDTELNFHSHYRGATLLNKDFEPVGLIASAEPKRLVLKDKVPDSVKKTDKLWLSNIGAGDQVAIKAVFSWSRK